MSQRTVEEQWIIEKYSYKIGDYVEYSLVNQSITFIGQIHRIVPLQSGGLIYVMTDSEAVYAEDVIGHTPKANRRKLT
jgi:hypothetical protein